MIIDYDSPAALKLLLEQRGFAMQKKFGQNFLINGHMREKIIDALEFGNQTTVWEVGPGLGAMTAGILKKKARLTAFEIDRGFCGILKDCFSLEKQFTLIEGDVLKTWKSEAEKNGVPDRFFGNLPYNIGATLLADFIEHSVRFDIMAVTLQKEVARRMAAVPGSDDYSSFSVLCGWAYEVKTITDLAGGCFWPRPNVDSRAVKLVKRSGWPGCENPAFFTRLVRALFSSRRKTVKNNLTGFFSDSALAQDVLSDAGIDPRYRAESLSVETLLKLSDIAFKAHKG